MIVFLSWSGARSHEVAMLLQQWLKCVLQATRPWLSSDVSKGASWLVEINDKLMDTNVGIVCVTQENRDHPWILFESGAIAKGVTLSRVCTFLIDIDHSDIQYPLAQFNHTQPNRNDVLALVKTLNSQLPAESRLDEKTLEAVFDTQWPSFEKSFSGIIAKYPASESVGRRDQNDILVEILDTLRSLDKRFSETRAHTSNISSDEGQASDSAERFKKWLAEGFHGTSLQIK